MIFNTCTTTKKLVKTGMSLLFSPLVMMLFPIIIIALNNKKGEEGGGGRFHRDIKTFFNAVHGYVEIRACCMGAYGRWVLLSQNIIFP